MAYNKKNAASGEAWLEGVFVEKFLPAYFPGCKPQPTFNTPEENEYWLDSGMDGEGETIVWIEFKPAPVAGEKFRQVLEADYQKLAAPFEAEVSKMGWDCQILDSEDNGTFTFEITVY